MIISWDLEIAMKKRTQRYGVSADLDVRLHRSGRWEALTSWDEDAIYEEEDDDWPTSDGDVLGDVVESGGRRGASYRAKQSEIPYEQQWELDLSEFEPGTVRNISFFDSLSLISLHCSPLALDSLSRAMRTG